MKALVIQNSKSLGHGKALLRKALGAEKDSRRYFGQYVFWVRDENIDFNIVVEQVLEVFGCQLYTAKKKAGEVISLGSPENSSTLESLVNGTINFSLALAKAGNNEPITKPGSKGYNDTEEARRLVERGTRMILKSNKTWKQKDLEFWYKEIAKSVLSVL